MPSPSEILLPALVLWLALVLLVPKRPWSTILARLSAAATGERRHPFGPPLQPAEGIPSRFTRLLVAELPRCVELGVPLWLATLAAEHRGFRRRRLAAAEHAASPAGWMWARALGRLSDEDLERRLTDAGYPAPAAKVRLPSQPRPSGPPPSWLHDLNVGAAEPAPDPTGSGNGRHQPTPVSSPRISVQVLGSLRVRLGEEDVTAELLARPTLSYLWQYLLLRAIQGSGPVPRSAVADEVYPGVDSETQHARIRRRLHDLQHKLPAFGRCMVVTDRDLRFDLESCDVDVVEILKLADDAGRSDSSGPTLLAGSMARALEDAVAATAVEPLPEWDELEYTVNRGRGQSGEHVRALRARVVEARGTLLARLGAHYLARRSAGQAVTTLDEAFRLHPGRDGVAEMLARALEAAGDGARAADVRRRYVQRE
jgi:DNA-binding SARP family transcriptional activator